MPSPRASDPRPSNTGVTPPSPVTPLPPWNDGRAPLESRFDWYELTADGLDDGRVAPALALATGGAIRPGKGRNGYARAEVVTRGEDVLATVYGGSAREGEVHVAITGEACDELVPVARRLWAAHRVSRADSAVDFRADFEQLDDLAVDFATQRGIKHEVIRNSDGGATRYLGGRSSEVRVRLYKKSEQLLALHPERAGEIPAGIVRVEIQGRPGKRAAREALSTLPPDDVWGLGEWARDFARTVLGTDPVRTSTHFRRPSDWSRSLHFLGKQYGPMVRERVEYVDRDAVVAEVLLALGIAPW